MIFHPFDLGHDVYSHGLAMTVLAVSAFLAIGLVNRANAFVLGNP